ncbi:MAG TPA: VOC family protein [Burkholderiaceae bacterium]|nr:VOC family protein [Burkholderiaceae bacterium]
MSDFNSRDNRAVWFDISVENLDRAQAFYTAVLGIKEHREQFEGYSFYVLAHSEGNGGCVVPRKESISGAAGILVYLNVDGPIRDACARVTKQGGRITQEIHATGPHGFRAMVVDSKGNRIALHSTTDT